VADAAAHRHQPRTTCAQLSASSFAFAPQQVQTQSPRRHSPSPAAATRRSPSPRSSRPATSAETDNCAGQTLAVNATCTVQIVFAPTATGTRNGQLTLYANIAGGQATVSLTGTGTAPAAITFTPPRSPSPPRSSTRPRSRRSSPSPTPAATRHAASAGHHRRLCHQQQHLHQHARRIHRLRDLHHLHSHRKRPAQRHTLHSRTAPEHKPHSSPEPAKAPATDTLAPSSLTFAQQQLATTSTAQQVTLTNTGDVALTLISASITGDFSVVNACGTSLAAHSTCAFNVSFTPTATGARSGVLTVTDQFRSQTVSAHRHRRRSSRRLAQPRVAQL
jgi:hypothetical protein